MTELRAQLEADAPFNALVHQLRPDVPRLVNAIVAQVQHEVPAYDGPATGRRHQLISMAAGAAINHFLDLVEGNASAGNASAGKRVDDLFRKMGRGEATDGHSRDPMRAAVRVATQQAWARLRTFTADHDFSAATLGQLGDAMFGYIDHLVEQIDLGFDWGTQAQDPDGSLAREHLLDMLLADERPSPARLARMQASAETAGWPLPEMVVTMSVSFHGGFPDIRLHADPLVRTFASPAVVVCDATQADAVAKRISRAGPGLRVAVSWPVAIDQVASAHRWCGRALRLVDNGVIPPTSIVDCIEHSTQLWLHAEPMLRQKLCQDLLAPLLGETPNSREILSETLLTWLELRDSAPAIAQKLGVHPQTVRYRWKRINELFGEVLHEPEFVVAVTMLLKASVPLWKAGDQSDFERYQAGRASS